MAQNLMTTCSKKHTYPPARLNGQATFPGVPGIQREYIECRHLAAQYIYDSLHNEAGKVDLSHFSSVNQIAQHVKTGGTEADCEKMLRDAQEAYLIKTDDLGKLLKDQFQQIENESQNGAGVRSLMVTSTNHAMAIRLRVKQHPQDVQKKIYVVKFYDPNFTDTTVRCEVDNIDKLNTQTLRQYIDGDGQHDPHYQRYFDSYEDCVMVHVCSRQAPEQSPLQISQGMALTCRYEELSPIVMWHLLRNNLAGELVKLFEKFTRLDAARQVKLLAAKSPIKIPGLFIALECGCAEAIRAYGTLLKQVPEKTLVWHIITLLKAKGPDGTSGLYFALQNGHAEAIQAYGELLRLVPEEALAYSLADMLKVKHKYGVSALDVARRLGHDKAIQAYEAVVDEFCGVAANGVSQK
ncbi:ShET2/EspL2 family type III secretion system effector toxin [Dyella sp. M7H15-1]|uniref:ShET2/EspL2 family type III secretion system effector toxin n=1 Tax=Dyella sp. M7H15-1 TaxID=2501295 RepID=UPI0010050816|nr:ShET2/EspL2 family type III secretion system effector toxin [Dyella sp. M7H15-1]QAU24032.1 ShET2/EspL2 family type III secretion system effector toxin [Dyella sp. M7H15-1]